MNKKLLGFLTPYVLFFTVAAYGALSEVEKSQIGIGNDLINPSAEGSTAGYSKSGGTFTTGGTVAGSRYFSWDSNAAGQTILSGYKTISAGDNLSGSNGVVSARFKCATGTCSHKLQVFDGTNVLAEKTINSSTVGFVRTSVNFIYPASGVVAWRLISVAADEPTVYWREGYRGLADGFNLSQVSQAQLLGTVKITGCSGNWTGVTASSYTSYSPQTGCVYTTSGAAVADASFGTTGLPAIKFASIAPGELKLEAEGSFFNGGTSVVSGSFYQFYDGTNSAREESDFFAYSNVGAGGPGISQSMPYTTAQSNVTLQVRAKSSNGQSSTLYGTTANPLTIKVWFFPSQSQTALRPDQSPASWSGYHTESTAWTTASTTFTDVSNATGITLTPTTARNITCTTASGSLPGITCSLPRSGTHNVRAQIVLGASTQSNLSARLVDGSGTVIDPGRTCTTSGANDCTMSLSGKYNVASAGLNTFKVQIATSTGNGALQQGVVVGTAAVQWEVEEGDAPMSAPYLVGSVTSNTSGQERVERITFGGSGGSLASPSICTTSPCGIYSQSGSWVSSVVRNSTGSYAINFAANAFSAPPSCTCATYGGLQNAYCEPDTVQTTSGFTVRTMVNPNTTLATVDDALQMICMGPR